MRITYVDGIQTIEETPSQYFKIEFQPYSLKELLYNTLKSLIS
jgi:hypothetical protein